MKKQRAGQRSRVSKQSDRKRSQPLSKLQCEKNQLIPETIAKPSVVMETPVKEHNPVLTVDSAVQTLPHIGRSCSDDVWVKMVGKEQNCRRSQIFVQKHPRLQPQMRSIVLDWLIEVSEAHALQRQTFYLAQDYFDRFMLSQINVDKSVLQLVGITCLFIASKMEESCPPKLSQMVCVTAGTYFEEEILQMELIILKVLRWNLCPDTAVSWLKLYSQMSSVGTQFSQDTYFQMTRILDLCTLSMNSVDFQYRVLAASVLCHFVEQEAVEKVSGLSGDDIQPCVNWMAPFVESLSRFGRTTLKDCAPDIQTHTDYLTLLEFAEKTQVSGPCLTPTSSTEKPDAH